MRSRESKIYSLLTHSFVIVMSCHVMLAMVLIFYPGDLTVTNTRLEKAYRLFGLTGPFFSEDRINVIPKVYGSVKLQGEDWNQFQELGESEFMDFHKNYFRYNQLLISGLPRYLCRQIKITETPDNTMYVAGMKEYLIHATAAGAIDSVRLVYTLRSFSDGTIDTLFVMPLGEFDKHQNP